MGGASTRSIPRWFGNAAAVQRPVSAIREHGELFRKVTPNPQFLCHAVGHLLIDLGFDQLGDVDGLQVEVVAETPRRLRTPRASH
jgi:hypothetical protein